MADTSVFGNIATTIVSERDGIPETRMARDQFANRLLSRPPHVIPHNWLGIKPVSAAKRTALSKTQRNLPRKGIFAPRDCGRTPPPEADNLSL
jgi:hypothetical protein